MLSPVPDEIFAGRLAEAADEMHTGAEHGSSAPVDRQVRRLAGAPEPKKTESAQGKHYSSLNTLARESPATCSFHSFRNPKGVIPTV